jgi:general secretion pathway protein J
MKRDPAWSRTAGFTLIEALVATMLMMVVLGALATVTTQWLGSWNRGFARIQRVDLWAAGLNSLIADLAAAEVVSTGGGKDVPVFDGAEHAVTFVRTSLGPNSSTGLEVVRIADASDDRGQALVRWTAPFVPNTASMTDSEFTHPVVMIRAPYPISFSYAGPDHVWRETWRGRSQLPRTIRVEVRDTDGTLTVSTSTFVRAELPARCAGAATTIDECLGIKTAADSGSNGPGTLVNARVDGPRGP